MFSATTLQQPSVVLDRPRVAALQGRSIAGPYLCPPQTKKPPPTSPQLQKPPAPLRPSHVQTPQIGRASHPRGPCRTPPTTSRDHGFPPRNPKSRNRNSSHNHRKSRWGDLNPRPHPYQGCALPLSYSGQINPAWPGFSDPNARFTCAQAPPKTGQAGMVCPAQGRSNRTDAQATSQSPTRTPYWSFNCLY